MGNYKFDVLVIGSGAAGYTAAIYVSRANLSAALITGYQVGGQLTTTTDVENYPGFAQPVQGPWLMEEMSKQAANVGTELIYDHVREVLNKESPFSVLTTSGDTYTANALIIATGAQAKWLGLDSEDEFKGYGVSGCATCDGFFFKEKPVLVVGGGNTAAEEALYLTNHASKVFLVHRRDSLRAERILQSRIFSNSKIEVIWNHSLHEVIGNQDPKCVRGARLASTSDEKAFREVEVEGIFIAIGHSPSTDSFKNLISIDSDGYILTPHKDSMKTSLQGVFAAGDVRDKVYRQAVTAAGDGCKAALEAIKYVDML